MKLEIKHLVPYLPYELKVLETLSQKIERIENLYNINEYDDIKISQWFGNDEHIWMFKPILRPIKEAEELIFEAFENTSKKGNKEIVDLFCSEKIGDSFQFSEYESLEWLPYESFIWLVKNHFDVFRLTEKGLAINKNEL